MGAAAAGQPQQQPAQVLYNYPPTLHGQVPAFYSQHLPGPPPMIANQAQPPPGNQQGQAVQPQSSTGGGQQALAQQHIQPKLEVELTEESFAITIIATAGFTRKFYFNVLETEE